MKLKRLLVAVLLAAGLGHPVIAQQARTARSVVHVESGDVAGERVNEVTIFKGIPYAAAPIGDRRWRAPGPIPAWSGVRDATQAGASCPQPRIPAPFGVDGPLSEDCLFLNVWRPAGDANKAHPVFVWVHGGAFLIGSGSQPLYDGAALARQGVVVVTLNYRLGALGFLSHRAFAGEKERANFGLLDQIAALRWVKRNIAAFGGDPANVTLAGESAGGVSVQALMASPAARGLFQKAIIQSGGGLGPFGDARSDAALTTGEVWAARLGAPNADLATLRGLPVERIIAAPFLAFPAVDGSLLDRAPPEVFARGEEARVPLLIGANSWEGSLTVLTDAIARAVLKDDYDDLLSAYQVSGGGAEAAKATLRGDVFFVQPARVIAGLHARRNPTWLYHFEQVPASVRGRQQGAAHGGEIAYLFGTPTAAMNTWDVEDLAISGAMRKYWILFMRAGNPNGPSAPAWRSAREHKFLVFGNTVRMRAASLLETRVAKLVTAASGIDASVFTRPPTR